MIGNVGGFFKANIGKGAFKERNGNLNKIHSNTRNQLKLADQHRSDAAALKNKEILNERLATAENAEIAAMKANPDNLTADAVVKARSQKERLQGFAALDDTARAAEASKLTGMADAANREAWGSMKQYPKGVLDYGMAKDMEGNPDRFKTAAMRVGAGVGIYAGAAAGARYVSGGGMTYNNQGQRDIAGIPFI